MKKALQRYLFTLTCTLILPISPLFAGYQSGLAAQHAGHYHQAIKEYLPIAKLGNIRAQVNLGFIYFHYYRDMHKAFYWYSQAAKLNNPSALQSLGVMYESGAGVPQDYQRALQLYQQAAKMHNTAAQVNLGTMYMKGEGVTQDDGKAKYLFELAAKKDSPQAYYDLGQIYYYGNTGPVNHQKGIQLYLKSARLGNKVAQRTLGFIYAEGDNVVAKNKVKAYYWFSLAAAQGSRQAQRALVLIQQKMTSHQIKAVKQLLQNRAKHL